MDSSSRAVRESMVASSSSCDCKNSATRCRSSPLPPHASSKKCVCAEPESFRASVKISLSVIRIVHRTASFFWPSKTKAQFRWTSPDEFRVLSSNTLPCDLLSPSQNYHERLAVLATAAQATSFRSRALQKWEPAQDYYRFYGPSGLLLGGPSLTRYLSRNSRYLSTSGLLSSFCVMLNDSVQSYVDSSSLLRSNHGFARLQAIDARFKHSFRFWLEALSRNATAPIRIGQQENLVLFFPLRQPTQRTLSAKPPLLALASTA